MTGSWPVTLTSPLWLFMLAAPLLSRYRDAGDHSGLERFIDPALQPWVIRGATASKRSALLPWSIWTLLVVALCGPALRQASPQVLPPSVDLVIVVDISPSMAADDLAPDRLTRLKLELRDFLRLAPPLRGALVVYSSEAYRLLPLTRDRTVLEHYIDALDLGMTRRRGSNLGQAIEVARDILDTNTAQSGGLLLLTDGETFAPGDVRAMAKRLGRDGIPIYALGIGTTDGAPIPDGVGGLLLGDDGRAVVSRLDRTLLRQLAESSGGAYSDLHTDDGDWKTLLDAMTTRLHPYRNDDIVWKDLPLFPYLIGFACMLLFWQGFRNPVPVFFLLAALMPIRPATASDWAWPGRSETRGFRALQSGDWQTAIRAYREARDFSGLMGLGFARYRSGDFEAARAAFADALAKSDSDIERAQAAYNLGTTEAHLKAWKAAQAAFNQALAYQPDYPAARKNLRLVEQAMASLHAGLRQSETAKVTRMNKEQGQFDTDSTPSKAERGKLRGANQTASRPLMDQALKQWGLDRSQDTSRQDRTNDDIRTVVRYRIARQENAHPPLDLGMPPW